MRAPAVSGSVANRRFIFLTLGYHPDQAGGAFRYVAEVAEGLAARGHQVHVVYPSAVLNTEQEVRHQVNLHRFPEAQGFFASNWITENRRASTHLRALLSDASPALVVLCHAFFYPCVRHTRTDFVSLFTGPWAHEFRFSRSGTSRSALARAVDRLAAFCMHRVERSTLQNARLILTISDYYVRSLASWHPGLKTSTVMMSGGVNLNRFTAPSDRTELRQRWGVDDRTFLFLAVRRLDARMGLSMLIQAFSKLPASSLATLWIAGKGPERDALQSQIEGLQQSHRIRLQGFVPEAQLPELYAAADCTVVPSLALEGFGLVLVESLACGTPVIGADSGAIPEVLSPLDHALLFPTGSEPALHQILERICTRRLSLPTRTACRTFAESQFRWDKPIRAVEVAFPHAQPGESAQHP